MCIRDREGSIEQADFNEIDDELAKENIPADPDVKNYSYTVVDDTVYYRENSTRLKAEYLSGIFESSSLSAVGSSIIELYILSTILYIAV